MPNFENQSQQNGNKSPSHATTSSYTRIRGRKPSPNARRSRACREAAGATHVCS